MQKHVTELVEVGENMNRDDILKEAERFGELSRCKREPVSKFPLEVDLLTGLKWADGGEKVSEAVNLFMVNSFFTFIDTPESIPGSFKTTRSKFLQKYPEASKLVHLAECFCPASLDSFTGALAKQLVKLTKGREVKTKDIKKALLVFGLLGRDGAFATLFKGKVYAVKHRRGLLEVFYAALRINGSPYAVLLGQVLDCDNPSTLILRQIKDIREIFTDENLLSDKNAIKRKKLKEYQLSTAARKHCEKLITEFYQDIVQDNLFVFKDLTFEKWQTSFIEDICGLRVARTVVWGLYEQQQLRQSFTVDLNGILVDSRGERLADIDCGNFTLNPVHPVELSPDEVDCWRQYFAGIGLKSLVEQLELPVFKKSDYPIDRYLRKPDILPESFWKRRKGWWYVEEESGIINLFKRDFVLGKEVKLAIEIETFIDQRDPYGTDPVLENIQVSGPGFDHKNLSEIPDRMYSELCHDIEKYFLRIR